MSATAELPGRVPVSSVQEAAEAIAAEIATEGDRALATGFLISAILNALHQLSLLSRPGLLPAQPDEEGGAGGAADADTPAPAAQEQSSQGTAGPHPKDTPPITRKGDMSAAGGVRG
jgi:hypothetical protein